MRIIVNGQQAFGRAVLEALLDRGEDVVGVYTAPDREGRPPDPLKACAVERGIPVFQPKSFRRPEVRDEMRALAPDLGVMAYVTLFVPEEALNVRISSRTSGRRKDFGWKTGIPRSTAHALRGSGGRPSRSGAV